MRAEGVSFHHALELLRQDYVPSAPGPVVKNRTRAEAAAADRRHGGRQKAAANRGGLLPPDVERCAGGAAVSHQARPSIREIIDRFKLGYANRSLCLHLPASNRAAGDAQRTRLKELGILRNQKPGTSTSMVRWLSRCSIWTAKWWRCTGGRSRRTCAQARRTPVSSRRAPGRVERRSPHRIEGHHPVRGADRRLDVLGCGLSAMSRPAMASTASQPTIARPSRSTARSAFTSPTTATTRATKPRLKLADELMGMGIECFRVQFPKGMDANEYALKTTPATKASRACCLTGRRGWAKARGPSWPERAADRPRKTEPAAKEKTITEPVIAAASGSLPSQQRSGDAGGEVG